MSNASIDNKAFLSEDFKKAAIIIQNMTAEMLCDPSIEFENLTDAQKNEVFERLLRFVETADEIKTPEDLHLFNNNLLMKRGWTNNHFNFNEKSTPLLCEFDELPTFVKTFVRASFAVLNVLVSPHKSQSLKEGLSA